jgi:hypothetical protein
VSDRWREIPGHPDYEIDRDRIVRRRAGVRNGRRMRERVLLPFVRPARPYTTYVSLREGDRYVQKSVATLYAMSWHGRPKEVRPTGRFPPNVVEMIRRLPTEELLKMQTIFTHDSETERARIEDIKAGRTYTAYGRREEEE